MGAFGPEGRVIGRSGLAKSASIWAECWDVGVRRCFLAGRWDEEVGFDWGMFSDMVVVGWRVGACARRDVKFLFRGGGVN